ncbi:MAG: CRISPR-associated helicase Cas3' [Cyanobacteriota bacterium]
MIHYSHAKKENGQKVGTKKLIDHLNQAKQAALYNLAETYFANYSKEDILKLLEYACDFHDLGKYTDYFQDYLLKEIDTGNKRFHSQISSIFAFNFLSQNNLLKNDIRNYKSFFTYYLIKNHHSSLTSLKDDLFFKLDSAQFKHYHNIQAENILQKALLIEKELKISSLKQEYFNLPETTIKNINNWLSGRDKNIENYFLILYCFSLLIEADKMNASNTNYYDYKRVDSDLVKEHLKSKQSKTSEINIKRTEVREIISAQLDHIDLNQPEIYTITAPTGIGKTLASLEFALKLKDKIENKNIQIIYCLPFINIIEQTANEFAKAFENEEIKILKHHQFTDIFSKIKENEDSEYKNSLDNALMELECWQADVIITTFVQLLHTIIGNKNRLLKKFNHLAGSIIILDEVQSIDIKYWPLIGASLAYLAKLLGSKIILMTATKPLLIVSAYKTALLEKDFILEKELLPNHKEYFEFFTRTQIVPLIKDESYSIEDFEDLFINKRQPDKSMLIVVNTIKRSLDVYKIVKESNIINENDLFYLSTNIIPAKRLIIINKIKRKLNKGEKIVLVSTQCVEAGVDLDFDMGFRDIGPIDSIIQVAGRINRNNHPEKEYSPLYIINFDKDCSLIYGAVINNCAKALLTNKDNIRETQYLDLIGDYFTTLIGKDNEPAKKSLAESIEIFEAMKKLNFTSCNDEKSVEDFELIKSKKNYVDLFIEIDCKASFLLKLYKENLNEKDYKKKKELYLSIKKSFNKFILSVPKDKIYELEDLKIGNNLYHLPIAKLNSFYDIETGFIRKLKAEDFIF